MPCLTQVSVGPLSVVSKISRLRRAPRLEAANSRGVWRGYQSDFPTRSGAKPIRRTVPRHTAEDTPTQRVAANGGDFARLSFRRHGLRPLVRGGTGGPPPTDA